MSRLALCLTLFAGAGCLKSIAPSHVAERAAVAAVAGVSKTDVDKSSMTIPESLLYGAAGAAAVLLLRAATKGSKSE